MSFDWSAYLALARQLAAQPREEAKRAAISRAYYSAFGYAAAYLVREGVIAAGRPGHDSVWSAFKVSGNADCQRVNAFGFNLRDLRNIADYEPSFPPRRSVAKATVQSLSLAARIIEDVRRLALQPWPGPKPAPETDAQRLRRVIGDLSPADVSALLVDAERMDRRRHSS